MEPHNEPFDDCSALPYVKVTSKPPIMDSVVMLTPTVRQRSVSTPDLDEGFTATSGRLRSTSSCQALRHALLTLYRIDDFMMDHLGTGFFSKVYKVTHMVTGEVMVLKMNTDEDNRRNVLREVQLMNRMSHPNILKFLGVCVHEGQLHSLTEYINGGCLHDLLVQSSEELPWHERVSIAIDTSSGIEYLHSKRVFHRDLTSRNVLISIDGTSKKAVVGDFGLATKVPDPNDEQFHLSVVGSPFWMSPECIKGFRYDQRADIFSFGILLCEVIARIDADPDEMPRTENFGLDYVAFSALAEDCPLHFLYLAFRCCQMEPERRPPFAEISESLQIIKQHKLVSPHANPIAAKSHIAVGHVQRHIHKFSKDLHKRSKSAGQLLDFLQTETQGPALPTAQFIGEHMTKEDPFYKPCEASVNPFESVANLREGKKLLASADEAEHILDTSMTLPVVQQYETSLTKLSHSLPEAPGLVKNAISQLNYQIVSSVEARNRRSVFFKRAFDDDSLSVDSAVDMCSTKSDKEQFSSRHRRSSSSHQKQLNLECAMLFCGLDLIQMQKSRSRGQDTSASDLESEFQGDLEDVLRSSSSSDSWLSDSWLSLDDIALSPTQSMSEQEIEWWKHVDPASRQFHPMLVEKRRQLRKVECRSKEKIELLQQKLDQLRLKNKKTKAVSSAALPRIVVDEISDDTGRL